MPAIGGIAMAIGAIIAAHEAASASEHSSTTQAGAANKAAELQAGGATQALDFTKQQAALDAERANATQKANYDQWAANQGYRSSIGQMLGLPARNIPDYEAAPLTSSSSTAPVGTGPTSINGVAQPSAATASPTAPLGATTTGDPAQMFVQSMQKHGLDPVAVQGHGATIVAALNQDYPGLGVTVDPKTDAVVWPGIGPVDVTIDSGKGGWSFRPSGPGTSSTTSATKATPGYVNGMSTLLTPVNPYVNPPTTPALQMPGGY